MWEWAGKGEQVLQMCFLWHLEPLLAFLWHSGLFHGTESLSWHSMALRTIHGTQSLSQSGTRAHPAGVATSRADPEADPEAGGMEQWALPGGTIEGVQGGAEAPCVSRL